MTSYRYHFILLLALFFTAASCHNDDPVPDDPPIEKEQYYTVPFSITIGITPMNGSADGVELKQFFDEGDVVEISNPQVLYEPLEISTNGNAGKAQFEFSGELKVKKGVELVAGSTKLTAALKNGTNYNNGKPFVDVKRVSSLAEGLEKFSYWSCENFVYNTAATSISLTQSTVFLNVNLFGAKVTMKYGLAFYNEIVGGNCFYAVPSGTTTEISDLGFEQSFDVDDKVFYRIGAVPPDNCLPGLFSVGDNKQVYFSTGNLQYNLKDGTWCLSSQQSHLGMDFGFKSIGENYIVWMEEHDWTDCFPWGSWLEGGSPYLAPKKEVDYLPPVDADGNPSSACAFGAEWTTLTADEWAYLLDQRPDALQKRGGAFVDGNQGWVLLPDYWVMPEGVAPLVTQFDVKYNEDVPNNYTAEEWSKMEAAGAVFLPELGYIFSTYTSDTGIYYQVLTFNVDDNIGFYIDLDFRSNQYSINKLSNCIDAYPVRLVQAKGETSEVKVE